MYFYGRMGRAFSLAARGAEANGRLISLARAAAAWELRLSRAALGRAAAHLNLLCQLELAVWVDNDHWYGGRVGSTVCCFLCRCRCCCRQLRLLLRGQRGRVPPIFPPQRAGNDQQADGHCHQETDARYVSHCGGRRAGGEGGCRPEGVADRGVARRRQLTPVSSCTGPATTSVSPLCPYSLSWGLGKPSRRGRRQQVSCKLTARQGGGRRTWAQAEAAATPGAAGCHHNGCCVVVCSVCWQQANDRQVCSTSSSGARVGTEGGGSSQRRQAASSRRRLPALPPACRSPCRVCWQAEQRGEGARAAAKQKRPLTAAGSWRACDGLQQRSHGASSCCSDEQALTFTGAGASAGRATSRGVWALHVKCDPAAMLRQLVGCTARGAFMRRRSMGRFK